MTRIKSTSARGYGDQDQRLRQRIARSVAAGHAICQRCGKTITSSDPCDLDHADDRASYLGPSHRRCNRGARRTDDDLRPERHSRIW
jgi:hypothetical protein